MKRCGIPLILPPAVRTAIAEGEAEFKAHGRFKVDYDRRRDMTKDQKLQNECDSILNAISQAAKGNRGQPPMVEKFRAAKLIADCLERQGVPFAVAPNSRMNKAVCELLNAMVKETDTRKCRRKKIKPTAVRALLRKVKDLRYVSALVVARVYC